MAISDKAKELTECIYKGYGSETGYLFGIPPDKREAVEAIVQCTLDHKEIEKFVEKEVEK